MSPAPAGTPRRAWLVWGVGVLAYAVAVFCRASLGVTGIAAQHRFGASAAALSLFSVLQLAVYAAMQVPVGVALDRVGSRRMLVAGAVLMAAGQVALATAHGIPGAIGARVLVGCGDAMTFISVLRLVPAWFAPRQAPVVTQFTGILGQVGQIAAAYPLVALLHRFGWTVSFVGAAGVGLLVAGLVAVALRDRPPGAPVAGRPPGRAEVRAQVTSAWREHGTRLGLWSHFATQFSGTVFTLLWGFPFLVRGEGRSPAEASLLLTVVVVVGMVVGPVLGRLVGGWPLRRSNLVLVIIGSTALAWTVVLLWPGRAPLPLLLALGVVLGTNGPGSMVGFDYARTANPPARLGSASGIVNVGGFTASLLTILAVGVVLDLTTTGGAASYTLGAFRAAFAVQYVVWAVGLAGVLRHRRWIRRRLAADGVRIDPVHRAVVRRVRARQELAEGQLSR